MSSRSAFEASLTKIPCDPASVITKISFNQIPNHGALCSIYANGQEDDPPPTGRRSTKYGPKVTAFNRAMRAIYNQLISDGEDYGLASGIGKSPSASIRGIRPKELLDVGIQFLTHAKSYDYISEDDFERAVARFRSVLTPTSPGGKPASEISTPAP